MASSESVANYFIQKSFDTGVPLTPMKLLKLVYIAHGWHLGYFHAPLINDGVQAWRYGPVIPKLYRQIKHYGRGEIDAPLFGHGKLGDGSEPPPHEQTLPLLDRVWEVYSQYDGVRLSAMTHLPDTPWDKVWRASGGDNYSGAIIGNDLMEEHYRGKIAAASQGG